MVRTRSFGVCAALAWVVAGPAAQQPQQHGEHPAPEKLGQVQFSTSCKGVQGEFNRAVALLHSFSFSTANRAFQDVLAKDPACAMAYWGQAMAQWTNPFGGIKPPSIIANGKPVIDKGLTVGSPTPRERAYLEAVAELYKNADTADHRTRIVNYERAMEGVARANPTDMEAQIFYALAANQTALPTDKTYAQQKKAIAILAPLYKQHPNHPGLAHYLIHANDAPALAAAGLDAAKRYASIAPSAPHALHMPSHTFTRVGYWKESVDTNIRSAEAAMRDGTVAEALHAMDYEVYAYLQMAMDKKAIAVRDEVPSVMGKLDINALGGAASGRGGLYATAAIPARFAMERGAWKEAAALATRTSPYPESDALLHFARAIGAARGGTPDAAAADLAQLEALRAKLEGMKDPFWTEQVRIQKEVATAWVTFAQGKRDEALAQLRKAADAEDATDKAAVSPGPLAPAREQLGEMLLAMNQPAAALTELEAVMKKEPRRFRATFGAGKAASLAGDKVKARKYFTELLGIAKTAETPVRAELAEARTFVGTK
jgi:tetratricopeptide (TPR) repeat protein